MLHRFDINETTYKLGISGINHTTPVHACNKVNTPLYTLGSVCKASQGFRDHIEEAAAGQSANTTNPVFM